MQTYCVSCKRNTGNKNAKDFKTKNRRMMLKSTCSVRGHKKSRFVSKNEGSGILQSMGLITPLKKIPLLGDILF